MVADLARTSACLNGGPTHRGVEVFCPGAFRMVHREHEYRAILFADRHPDLHLGALPAYSSRGVWSCDASVSKVCAPLPVMESSFWISPGLGDLRISHFADFTPQHFRKLRLQPDRFFAIAPSGIADRNLGHQLLLAPTAGNGSGADEQTVQVDKVETTCNCNGARDCDVDCVRFVALKFEFARRKFRQDRLDVR